MTNNETGRSTDDAMTEGPEQAGLRLPDWLTHPVVCVAAVLVVAPALFLMGRQIGITLYAATDGEPRAAMVIGIGLAVLVGLVALGAWVDTRRKRRGD